MCELNNRTKEATLGNFVPNPYRYYFKRNTETGKLVYLVFFFSFDEIYYTSFYWVSETGLRLSVKEDLRLSVKIVEHRMMAIVGRAACNRLQVFYSRAVDTNDHLKT